jgi:hypothetical protein
MPPRRRPCWHGRGTLGWQWPLRQVGRIPPARPAGEQFHGNPAHFLHPFPLPLEAYRVGIADQVTAEIICHYVEDCQDR